MFKETLINKLSEGLVGEELEMFKTAASLIEEVEGESLVETLTNLRESIEGSADLYLEEKDEEDETEEDEGEEDPKKGKKKKKDEEDEEEMKESYIDKINSRLETGEPCCDASFDLSEDMNAMFAGSDLNEEFKQKATLVFEAAVARQVSLQVESYKEKVEAEIENLVSEEVDTITDKLSTTIDQYLNYVVEEWMAENTLAIETGIRNEITEGFISGLKNLFIENYIDIPEGKEDILAKVSSEKVEIEEEYEAVIQKNIQLMEENKDLKKGIIVSEITKDLTESQSEKLQQLAESLDFEGTTEFTSKVATLKESYFNSDSYTGTDYSLDTEEFIIEDYNQEPDLDPKMKSYAEAISKYIK